jgi:hypothetical protein
MIYCSMEGDCIEVVYCVVIWHGDWIWTLLFRSYLLNRNIDLDVLIGMRYSGTFYLLGCSLRSFI